MVTPIPNITGAPASGRAALRLDSAAHIGHVVSEALHLVAVVDSGVGDFESTDRLADVGRRPVIIAAGSSLSAST